MSRSPSLLEAQFANFSTRPDYGTAQEGVLLYDMDRCEPVTPEDVGLAANLDSINGFMVSRGVDPDHLKYTTIALFGPDSSYGTIPGTPSKRAGFVSDDLHISGGATGLRFPVIALEYDSDNPDIDLLNFNLRHEISHLQDANSLAPYNNERLIARIKAASATIGALVTPSAVDMWNRPTIIDAFRAGIGPVEYTSALGATSLSALAAVAMACGLVYNPHGAMHAFSLCEYKANHFSRKNQHFQPFSQA